MAVRSMPQPPGELGGWGIDFGTRQSQDRFLTPLKIYRLYPDYFLVKSAGFESLCADESGLTCAFSYYGLQRYDDLFSPFQIQA